MSGIRIGGIGAGGILICILDGGRGTGRGRVLCGVVRVDPGGVTSIRRGLGGTVEGTVEETVEETVEGTVEGTGGIGGAIIKRGLGGTCRGLGGIVVRGKALAGIAPPALGVTKGI